MIFITNTFSCVAFLEEVRNRLNDVITNATLNRNDFKIPVSNIGPQTDKHHHWVYYHHEILCTVSEGYKDILGKERTLKRLIDKWNLVPESTMM